MAADGGSGNDNGGGGSNGAASKGKEPKAKKPLRAQAVLGAIRQQRDVTMEESSGSPEGQGGSSSSTTTTSSEPAGDGEKEQQQPPQAAGAKRPRLVWTTELHQKFVRACRTLGPDAVPKKILRMMDVPGITRENVASHLQKYRVSRDRAIMVRSRAVARPKALPLQARSQAPSTSNSLHQRGLSLQARSPPQAPSISNTLHQRALHLQARSSPQAPSTSTSSLHQRSVPTHGHGHFAAPSMFLQQQLGHAQVVQGLQAPPPPTRYVNNAPRSLLHQHQTNLPVAQAAQPRLLRQHPASPAVVQPRLLLRHHPASPAVAQPMPMQHRYDPSVLHMEAARRQKLFMEQQAARMQQAAAARMQQQAAAASAGYNHMPVVGTTSYGLGGGAQAVITGTPAAGGVQSHPPDMQASSSQDVNMSGERSVSEAGMEGMEPRMARLTIAAKAEGQELAAEPAAAAPVDPDHSHEDDLVVQYLISEPSWGYGFPSK